MQNNIKAYLENSYESIKKQRSFIYGLNSLPKITVKGFSDFFTDTPAEISFNFSNQAINLENKKMYLSLFEKTTNFEKLPINSNYKLVGNQLFINGEFIIKEKIKCILYVLFYDECKNIHSHALEYIGDKIEKLIEIPKNAVSYRIAIKIEGSGSFQINRLLIEQKLELTVKTNNLSDSFEKTEFNKIDSFKTKIKNLKYNRKVKNKSLKIASILDEFSEDCFKFDCNLLPLSKDNWQKELLDFNPDFLFVESCWQGNRGSWAYEVVNLHINKHRTELKKLTDYCQGKGIKTVFWDKEGVENFDFFKEAAKYFDYIFTADENNISNFKDFTKNINVFELPFAAQPQIHNPIYKNKNYLGKIAFAGSYYNNKHELRKRDISEIIKPAIKYGVEIFDRYFGTDPSKYPNNQWPEEYKNNIVGSLKYEQMVEAYKNYDIFLNVNSVQNSKNMFARRVFEVLSSKTLVISGPSIGVESLFGEIVPVVKTKEEVDTCLRVYTRNPALREKKEKEGARMVLKYHTYKNRLQEICNKIGLEMNLLSSPKVTIVSSTQREEFMDELYKNINHQTYENIEVVIVLNKNSMNISKWKKKFEKIKQEVKILQVEEQNSLGYCLNEAIKNSSGEIIAKFDDDDFYAPNYLTDMVLSMDYSNADIVGKSAHFLYFEENNLLVTKQIGSGVESYSDFVAGATLVFKRSVYETLGGFSDRNKGEDSDFLKRAKESGLLIFSGDSQNYCCLRRKNKENHTWKIDDDTLLRSSTSHIFTTDYKTPVIL